MARVTATCLRSAKPAVAALLAALLAACGGGGSSTGPATAIEDAASDHDGEAAALAVRLEVPQRLAPGTDIGLRWQLDGSAARVVVEVQRDAAEEFAPVQATVDGATARFVRGPAWRYDFPSAKVRVRACDAGGGCVRSNEQPLGDALLAGITTLRTSAATSSLFGTPVSLDAPGRTLIAAAPILRNAEPQTLPGLGAMVPFVRGDDGAWASLPIVESFAVAGNFGDPHALSGDGRTLAVGAYTHGSPVGGINPPMGGGDGSWYGAVYVYARDEGEPWRLQAFLKAAMPIADEALGRQVSISHDGNRLLAVSGGRSILFERAGTTWRQAHEFEVAANAISGDGRTVAGLVVTGERPNYTYEWPVAVRLWRSCPCSSGWRREVDLASGEPLRQPDVDGSSYFGWQIVLNHDGTTVVTGDTNDLFYGPDRTRRSDTFSGALYVFEASAEGWQRQKVKTRSAPLNDFLGHAVSVSANGRVIASAACGFSAGDTGVRRNHPAGTVVEPPPFRCDRGGAAYVFERADDGRWIHTAAAIPEVRAWFAYTSLALSADGSSIALGLPTPDSPVDDPARVVVY